MMLYEQHTSAHWPHLVPRTVSIQQTCIMWSGILHLLHSQSSMCCQEKRQDRQQQHQQASTVRGRLVPGGKGVAAPDADISSDETHAKASVKGDVAGALAFAAPSKSGGSELFDALLMAATGALIFLCLGTHFACTPA